MLLLLVAVLLLLLFKSAEIYMNNPTALNTRSLDFIFLFFFFDKFRAINRFYIELHHAILHLLVSKFMRYRMRQRNSIIFIHAT